MSKKENTSLRHPMSKARGHGSAKEGVSHWVWQRLTAIVIAPLAIWLIGTLLLLTKADNTAYALSGWFSSPGVAILVIIFFAAVFYHATLGLQVVIEDYVGSKSRKISYLILNKIIFAFAAIITIMAIAKLHFMV